MLCRLRGWVRNWARRRSECAPKIIKTACLNDRGEHLISLYGDHYSHSLAWLNSLVSEAMHDYPGLKPEEINVVIYGGERIKHVLGIEFLTTYHTQDYDVIHQPELTL